MSGGGRLGYDKGWRGQVTLAHQEPLRYYVTVSDVGAPARHSFQNMYNTPPRVIVGYFWQK